MGFVAEGHNYQDYMISHRWDTEEVPSMPAAAPAPTTQFNAESSDSGIVGRITGMFSDILSMAKSQPLLAGVAIVGLVLVVRGFTEQSE